MTLINRTYVTMWSRAAPEIALSKRRSELDLSLHGLFNGRIQWAYSMGVFNGRIQWAYSMAMSHFEMFSLRVPARQTRSTELFALTNQRVSACNILQHFATLCPLLSLTPCHELSLVITSNTWSISSYRRDILSSFYADHVIYMYILFLLLYECDAPGCAFAMCMRTTVIGTVLCPVCGSAE